MRKIWKGRNKMVGIDIYIDSLTNCLRCRETGEEVDTEYRLVYRTISSSEARELKRIGWKFDWSKPHKDGCEIYELLLAGTEQVQGMIALRHNREQYFTRVELVESAPQNIGSGGKYEGVGAHLFAVACKLSWDAGNEGYVQFVSKTDLIEHYRKALDAKLIDWHTMYIDSYGAIKLINKYLKEGV